VLPSARVLIGESRQRYRLHDIPRLPWRSGGGGGGCRVLLESSHQQSGINAPKQNDGGDSGRDLKFFAAWSWRWFLIAAAAVVVVMVVPQRAAAAEIVTANPIGAAWTALAERTTTTPLAPTVTPWFGEEFAQAFDGAADALLRGIVGRAEGLADFAQGLILEVAEEDGSAVAVVERVHGFVEQRFDLCPVGGGGVHGIHLRGNLFAQLAACFAADDINGSRRVT